MSVTGRAIGRHPLAPTISPKKTIEGFIGGWVGGFAAVMAAAYAFQRWDDLSFEWWHVAVIGLSLPLAATVGDLTESAIKRARHIKDASELIPGHGGFMDRMDGVVTAALAAGLSIYMPLYAALLCSAGLLLAIGAACVGTATRKPNTSNQLVEVPVQPFTLSDMTYRLLEEEIHARPGKAAAAAVVAGFILGALEALEKRKGRSVS